MAWPLGPQVYRALDFHPTVTAGQRLGHPRGSQRGGWGPCLRYYTTEYVASSEIQCPGQLDGWQPPNGGGSSVKVGPSGTG